MCARCSELKKREIIAKRKEKAAKKAEIEALKKEVRKSMSRLLTPALARHCAERSAHSLSV